MPQIDKKQVFPKVAEAYGVPPELVESIGNHVFKAWAKWQKKPDNLILNIKDFGRQYLRYKKTLTKKEVMFAKNFDYTLEENNSFEDQEDYNNYLWQKEWMDNIHQLLSRYKNEYMQEAKEIKKYRDEHKKPMDPIKLQKEKQARETKDFEF